MALLEVDDLRTHFATDSGEFRAVDGVSFAVDAGKTLGIVGESGCGKSVTSLSVMGLLPARIVRVAGGSIRLKGPDLLTLDEDANSHRPGHRQAMIFPDAMK